MGWRQAPGARSCAAVLAAGRAVGAGLTRLMDGRAR